MTDSDFETKPQKTKFYRKLENLCRDIKDYQDRQLPEPAQVKIALEKKLERHAYSATESIDLNQNQSMRSDSPEMCLDKAINMSNPPMMTNKTTDLLTVPKNLIRWGTITPKKAKEKLLLNNQSQQISKRAEYSYASSKFKKLAGGASQISAISDIHHLSS